MLEVEVKAPCPQDVRQVLMSLGARKLKTESQTDTYFNSPLHDFSKTDEALRVRKVGKKHFLTYKGPKLDSETKMREEIEFPVDSRICEVLEKLGFREVAVVRKRREIFSFRNLVVCLDSVEGLGDFIEIEGCDPKDKKKIFSLLRKLGVDRDSCTRLSYLELLVEKK
jgi:adenylate cyclase, class 2